MAGPILRFPLTRHCISDAKRFAYRFAVRLEIQTDDEDFVPLPFRLDSGSDFMTIPQGMARLIGISFSEESALFPKTAAGRASKPSFISPVAFSFPKLPQRKFRTDCVFSPYNLPYCLLALSDFVPHFLIRSNKEPQSFPPVRSCSNCLPTTAARAVDAGVRRLFRRQLALSKKSASAPGVIIQ